MMFRLLLYVSIIIGSVAYGFSLAKYKIFPYENLKTFATRVRADVHIGERSAAESSGRGGVELAGKPVQESMAAAIAIERELDTALLPLRIRSVPVNNAHELAAMAGGIAMVADHLVVMDRLGNFYQCKGDCSSLAKVQLPPLPNNIP